MSVDNHTDGTRKTTLQRASVLLWCAENTLKKKFFQGVFGTPKYNIFKHTRIQANTNSGNLRQKNFYGIIELQ